MNARIDAKGVVFGEVERHARSWLTFPWRLCQAGFQSKNNNSSDGFGGVDL